MEEKIETARMIEGKQEEEKDLIEIRMVEEIFFGNFHKYLKIFEKKKSEKMLIRKTWNYTIDCRKGFVPKKRKIYPLSRIEKEKVQKFIKDQLMEEYI